MFELFQEQFWLIVVLHLDFPTAVIINLNVIVG